MTARAPHCPEPAAGSCWFPACGCPVPETREYDPGPVPDGMDGAGLLDHVHEFLCAYVVFPSTAAAVAATLWAAHTHLVGQFESTPRLALLSPEKQCGKSRTLELRH